MLLLLAFSCGKKPEDGTKDLKSVVTRSEAEIHFNSLQELRRSVNQNDLRSLQKVLRENPFLDLNQYCDDGETLLTIAIKKDLNEIRNFLLDHGASIEKPTVNKETPLMAAVSMGRMNSLKVLLDRKVELNKKDANGDTALHMAIKAKNQDMALLLIKQGANIEITDKSDRNAYKLAQENETLKVVELIKSLLQVEYGTPDVASFRSVLSMGDVKGLNVMLSRFPRLAIDYDSINPLLLVLEVKDETAQLKLAHLLIAYQSSIDGPKDAEVTPLIRSVELQNLSLVNILLEAKAKTELVDKDGKSALIHAVELNNLALVNRLVQNEALIKYTVRKNSNRITFNACSVAKKVAKKLSVKETIEENIAIQESLNCGFWSWFF